MADYDIGAAFEAIEDELIASMIRNMKRHRVEEADNEKQWEMWQAKQLESLEEYKRKNRKKYKGTFTEINDSIDKVIRKAYQEGGMEQEIEILKSIKKKYGDNVPNRAKRIRDSILSKTPFGSKTKQDYFQVNDKKLDALIHATTSDMTKAESAMLRMADDQYRKIIFNAQVYANSGAGTYEQAVDMATKDFLGAGINCIEYKDGRRVNIKSYAEMAIRTADKRAALYADGELRKKLGISTVITKKRLNACPKCLPFVDKILNDDVWSGGKPEDGPYPLLSKAMEAGFLHPNCKDHLSTYIPGITEPPEGSFTKDEVGEVEEAAKWEAKQQYAANQAEKFERLAEYSLDEDNKRCNELRAGEWYEKLEKNESTDTNIIKRHSEFVDMLRNDEKASPHKANMAMYSEFTELKESSKLNAPFAYISDEDIIKFNPNASHISDYDLDYVFAHETSHRMDELIYHSWENQEFLKALDSSAQKIYDRSKEIQKWFDTGGIYENNFEVSDLINALSNGNISTFIGHDKAYWARDKDLKPKEVFADLSSIDVLMTDYGALTDLLRDLFEAYHGVIG